MKLWSVAKLDKTKAGEIQSRYELPAIVAMLLQIRNITTKDEIEDFLYNDSFIADPFEIKDMDKAVELLDDLALNILYDEKNTGDPFWEKSGADYFSGLALGLFEDATKEQVNLNSMNLMSNLGEERFGGPNNNYIKELFPNTPYNSLQINNKNMNHIINLYPTDTNISVGRNNALNKLIALNNAIQFSVIGNLNRKSGYFIVINKQSASSDNQFFNKILGKYFILNIHHIFNDKRYTNNIIACKPFYNTEPIAPLNYILENE